MFKRIMIIVLALVIVLSFSSMAFANNGPVDKDNNGAYIENGNLYLPSKGIANENSVPNENPIEVLGRK